MIGPDVLADVMTGMVQEEPWYLGILPVALNNILANNESIEVSKVLSQGIPFLPPRECFHGLVIGNIDIHRKDSTR